MYQKSAEGWLKHIDFIIIDELSLQVALIIANFIRHRQLTYTMPIYRTMGIVLAVLNIATLILFNTMHNVLKRSAVTELVKTFQHSVLVFALTTSFMFATQNGKEYSRIVLFLTAIFHFILGYITRLVWKWVLLNSRLTTDRKGTLLLILTPDNAEEMIHQLEASGMKEYRIVGAVLSDGAGKTEVGGVPIVADIDSASSYICQEWIDGVYIDASADNPKISKLIADCHEMAVPVHYHIPAFARDDAKQFAEKIGGTMVLTSSFSYATVSQMFFKRCLDIIGGLIGSVFALLVMMIVGPMIKKASPGPIIYSQERVGQNGKRFRILKLRSMYMNADEKKKELMEQNRVKDGMMFKMDFDPRIIGNEILPDGTKKTGIGEFIRRTSLDEFPQFFNVLAGQMSLVGTRPPTVDEWEKYEFHHRARLACKPGITGMWQVSGRSEITDFEEVVKLDTSYIANWSMALDIKILFKTIGTLFTGRGAM